MLIWSIIEVMAMDFWNNDFWSKNERNQAQFKGGRHDWRRAAEIAAGCPHFLPDSEDEQPAEEERSCYNCRFRRWTEHSFTCMKHCRA